jgi:geranylgeranyl diphosphate synthase type II
MKAKTPSLNPKPGKMNDMGKALYNDILNGHLASIEKALPQYLPTDDSGVDNTLFEAMEYACAAGGKRLRPVLVLEFCRLCGGDVKSALPFACAVEMIHSYSLVHDDLPCMDDSPLRRGRPSVHAAFGEPLALLAGDALLNRAFEIMLGCKSGLYADKILDAALVLATAAGSLGMVGGQVLDLESECRDISIDTLEKLQLGKTAALLSASCEIGCCVAGADNIKQSAAREYGKQLGCCFQIVDDILDATSTTDELGKPAGKDLSSGKATYVTLLGLEKARTLADRRTEQAINALIVFGDDADGLRSLAYSLLSRNK